MILELQCLLVVSIIAIKVDLGIRWPVCRSVLLSTLGLERNVKGCYKELLSPTALRPGTSVAWLLEPSQGAGCTER